jgi:hypothetical protein
MEKEYEIRVWHDDQYAVYKKDKCSEYVFKGSLSEINAWISLKEKGFDL